MWAGWFDLFVIDKYGYTLDMEAAMDHPSQAFQDRFVYFMERSNQVSAQMELKTLLDQVLALIMEACQAQAGFIYLLEQETGWLVCETARGISNPQGRGLLPEDGLVARAMQGAKPILVEDVEAGALWDMEKDGWHGCQPHCFYAFPLKQQGKPVGWLSCWISH
jgi:transcriptional regulator with GAF, ATPase, and Fis domain